MVCPNPEFLHRSPTTASDASTGSIRSGRSFLLAPKTRPPAACRPPIFTSVPERLAGLCSPPKAKDAFAVVWLPVDETAKTGETSGAVSERLFGGRSRPVWRRRRWRLQTDAFGGIRRLAARSPAVAWED